jgi:hypothetical protein
LAVGPSIAYRGAKSGTVFISRDLGKLSGLGDSRTQGGGGAGNWELGTPPSPAPPRRDPPAATHFSFLPPQPILSKLSLSLSLFLRVPFATHPYPVSPPFLPYRNRLVILNIPKRKSPSALVSNHD